MNNAKKYLKGLLKFLLASVWCAGLSVGTLTLYHQQFQPASSLDLDALEQSLLLTLENERQVREAKLEQLADKLTDMDELLGASQDNITALQVGQQEQGGRLALINQRSIDKRAFTLLEQRLSKVEQQLSQFGQRSLLPPVEQVHKPKPKAKPTITPPFTLFDVQKRGTHYLAIVGKPEASRLSELSALRAGSRYLNWQLVSVQPSYVIVRHNDQEVTLEVGA